MSQKVDESNVETSAHCTGHEVDVPKKPIWKRVVNFVLGFVLVFAAIIASYFGYMEYEYYRIEDNVVEEIVGVADHTEPLKLGEAYTTATYNIGFGAYTPEYTFFLDTGIMNDGTETVGTLSKAVSKKSVVNCTKGDIELLKKGIAVGNTPAKQPDFMLLQEVDVQATRSHWVNQVDMITDAFKGYQSVFSTNFHSPYLMMPLNDPHGSVHAGLLTLSDHTITSALRRSYPIDQTWPTKYADLDRCFLITRMAVENGKEFVLVNSHMSAYDANGGSRAQQIALLKEFLSDEYSKGNYVIVGGDWNQALCGSVELYPSQQKRPEWVTVLNDDDLPEGFSVVCPDNLNEVATCRGADIPYEKGVTYRVTIDGFIISDNIDARAMTIENDFTFSDHNPQIAEIILK